MKSFEDVSGNKLQPNNLPAMISRSLGSRLTVQGKNVFTSRATRTGVLEDRNTSKFLISPSISSSGSTSLVVGIFFDILQKERNGKSINVATRVRLCILKLAASVHKEHVTHTVFSFKNILDDKAKEEKIII